MPHSIKNKPNTDVEATTYNDQVNILVLNVIHSNSSINIQNKPKAIIRPPIIKKPAFLIYFLNEIPTINKTPIKKTIGKAKLKNHFPLVLIHI